MQLSLITPSFARTARIFLPRARLPVALGFHTTSAASRTHIIRSARIYANMASLPHKPFPASKSHLSTSASASSSSQDPRIEEILTFWFSLEPRSWFGAPSAAYPTSASLDDAIKAHFQDVLDVARAGKLDEEWTKTPKGTLALLILLDQFPRNVYRGTKDAFASDAHALSIAVNSIAKGFDRAFDVAVGEGTENVEAAEGLVEKEKITGDSSSLLRRVFFYLPFSHTEDLLAQVAAVALSESLLRSCPETAPERPFLEMSFGFFKRHRDAILRLGRFPARNVALGRTSTEEEIKLLKENPYGF
ncbi:hypothetical protein EV127DRAFT_428258 [Xylaria flabelliformis]|nr:hypothetical protein EV127DRAFT_428258 [Xylaria flabelliformis]